MSTSYKSANVKEWEKRIEEKRMDLESGALGKFFGSGSTAPNNIAGFAVVIGFVLAGIITSVFLYIDPKSQNTFEIWKYIGPIITGALGFIFGRGSKNTEQ
jgi:hypothetical protein